MTSRMFRSSVTVAVTVAVGLLLASWVVAQKAAPGAGAPTPRLANGKPDLSGNWAASRDAFTETVEGNEVINSFASRRCGPTQKDCLEHSNQSYDGEFTGRFDPNRPMYKPQYWDKVQELDYNTNFEDPTFLCQPAGVPRMGPPTKIAQTANEVIFLYAASDAATAPADYRIIPTDGRKHDPVRARDVLFYGHSVGRWEGDTLVVDSVGFNDLTWLDRGGYFHSDNMRVLERFRREGNTVYYDVTVEDPDVLMQPWVKNTRQLTLNTDPSYYIHEQSPCKEIDLQNTSTRVRH
jgi:hypothetical protein